MRIVEKNIEWLVVIAVVLVTTYEVIKQALGMLDLRLINGLVTYLNLFLIFILFYYQNRHYGRGFIGRPFCFFFTIYCAYILGDMTLFRKYPLELMAAIPQSVFHFFRTFLLSIGYLYCAETIVRHFNVRKYVIVSVIVCTIPSLVYVNYVGMEAIQNFEVVKGGDDYLSGLTIGFSNAPILVLCLIFMKTLFHKKMLSYIFSIFVITIIAYLFFALAKRGPILWTAVNLVICFFLTKREKVKMLLMLGIFLGILAYLNLDSIIDRMKEVAPKTGARIESTLLEGDTDGRFDVDHPESSTYLIGIDNFMSSPLWGYYFRLVTNSSHFKGGYAHNVFIEVLMTMGVLGFIPFILLLWKAYLNSSFTFRREYNANQLAFLVLFLSSFLMLQTSRSIVFRMDFWLPFYILYILNKLPVKNNKLVEIKT